MENRYFLQNPTITEEECCHISENYKTDFIFNSHQHTDFELIFIENGAGLRRIVGDSMEYIDNYELILICENKLEHLWEKGVCKSKMIRFINIQFPPDLIGEGLLNKKEFSPINDMFRKARLGICFPLSAIMKVYAQLDTIASEKEEIKKYIKLVTLLHDLSKCEGIRSLSSSSYALSDKDSDNEKIKLAKDMISENFHKDITLTYLAELAGMTPVSFSRFFKQKCGKNLSNYIIDVRLSYASKLLVETSKSISAISYESGFNNLSNFNRIFKKKKGITPKVFRSHFRKNHYS